MAQGMRFKMSQLLVAVVTMVLCIPASAGVSENLDRAGALVDVTSKASSPEEAYAAAGMAQLALEGANSEVSQPVAAQGPATRNQSGLQNYIKSEYGGNWDPGWEREASRSVPAPKAGKGQDGSQKGILQRLSADWRGDLVELAMAAAAAVLMAAYMPATAAAWVTSRITGKLNMDPNVGMVIASAPIAAIAGVATGLVAGPVVGALSAVGVEAAIGALAELAGRAW